MDVKVPDIGDFKNVPVITVLVKVGDTVAKEDPLVELESDKATMEVPSPAAGKVVEIKVAEGDKVWCRLRTNGSHTGEWRGIPPTGRQWTNTGIWFFQVSDGKIVEAEWKMDELNLLRQLGATISPPAASV